MTDENAFYITCQWTTYTSRISNTLKYGKLFATQALSQTQKNVSEPQTGIEPATFWSPVRRSNHWAIQGLRLQREGHDVYRFVSATHVTNTAVSICQYILLTNISKSSSYIYIYIYSKIYSIHKLLQQISSYLGGTEDNAVYNTATRI